MNLQSKLQRIIESCFEEHGFTIEISGYTIEYDCSRNNRECVRHYFYLMTNHEIPLELYPLISAESKEIAEEQGLFKDISAPQYLHLS